MQAGEVSELTGRSSSQQIEDWVRLGKFAEDHSDLTGQMLQDILNAQSPQTNSH